MSPERESDGRAADDLDRLSGVDLSIGIAAAPFAAAGDLPEQAIRRAIEILSAVPGVRAAVQREAEESRLTITLDDLQAEFGHADHRQIREYVRELWAGDANSVWIRALSGEAAFSKRQADAIRAHRVERRRRRPVPSKFTANEAEPATIEGSGISSNSAEVQRQSVGAPSADNAPHQRE